MAQALRCVVVTPEKAVLDETADFVVVPMYDGELGIAHNRQPLIGRLGVGELRITQGNQVRRFFIDGGFVQVRDNVITVLTSKATAARDIKVGEAEAILRKDDFGTTPEARAAEHKAHERARAQIRIAQKAS